MEPISRRGLLCHADHKSDDNPDDRRSLTFENLPAAERFKTFWMTTPGPRGHIELTPQEEAVTSLVAQGLSNREVAAELYVSPKTVQYHLTRIYAKLGVRSRSELAALRR